MQRSFLTMATGDPFSRNARSLPFASDGFAFSQENFARFYRHLLDTVAAYGISDMETRGVAIRIRSHQGATVAATV